MKLGELIILWVSGLLSVALIAAAPTSEPFMMVMVGSAWAAQIDPDQWVLNCTEWNRIDNPQVEKLAYVHGYLQGIQAVADKFRKDEIIIDLWPIGHRVASVAIEIDVYCLRAENRNVSVWQLIQRMAREKRKQP
jgi:hypothetical protein